MANGLARRVARKTASVCGDICIIGCVIIILPFWCTTKLCIKCHQTIQHSARQGERCYLVSESKHPPALPFRRAYNLSNENIPLVAQPTASRLMNLPYDVRKLIWEFAVGGAQVEILHKAKEQRLHFSALHKGPSTFRTCKHATCSTWSCYSCMLQREDHADLKKKWWNRKPPADKEELLCCTPTFALLKTCRQIYQEIIPIVYAKNKFIFHQVPSIPFWINSVRRQHMARVRRLKLNLSIQKPAPIKDWISACYCIGTWMKSLDELEITLYLENSFATLERGMLEPLKDISGLKEFNLNIRYKGSVVTTPQMNQYRKLIRKLVMRPRGEPWESLFCELLVQEWRRGRALSFTD